MSDLELYHPRLNELIALENQRHQLLATFPSNEANKVIIQKINEIKEDIKQLELHYNELESENHVSEIPLEISPEELQEISEKSEKELEPIILKQIYTSTNEFDVVKSPRNIIKDLSTDIDIQVSNITFNKSYTLNELDIALKSPQVVTKTESAFPFLSPIPIQEENKNLLNTVSDKSEVAQCPIEFSIIEADFMPLIDDCSSTITSSLPPKLSWNYPSALSSLSVHGISNFCFPSGVEVNFRHQFIASKYVGKHADERHILQFLDTNGVNTYACCLVISTACPSPSIDVSRALTDVNRRIKAANLLKSKISKFVKKKRFERWNQASTMSLSPIATQSIASNSLSENHQDESIFTRNHISANTKAPSFFSKLMIGLRGKKENDILIPSHEEEERKSIDNLIEKNIKVALDRWDHDDSESDMTRTSTSQLTPSNISYDSSALMSPNIPTHIRFKDDCASDHNNENDLIVGSDVVIEDMPNSTTTSSSDYEADFEDENLCQLNHKDHMIITRRAYCMITKEAMHAKVFQILQAIANAERNVFLTSARPVKDQFNTRRKEFLDQICLHINDSSEMNEPIHITAYIDRFCFQRHEIYPKLHEWALAVLMTYVSTSSILKIISLLLMEKSLIIYGSKSGIVTAISLAVKELLVPFQWEGVFLPLVPNGLRELFDAPVPFIGGTVAKPRMADITSSTAVLILQEEVIDDEIQYSSWFQNLPEVNAHMPVEDSFSKQLTSLQSSLLQSMRLGSTNGSSTNKIMLTSMISPDIYFTSKMSQSDREIVSSFLTLIYNNNFSFFRDFIQKPSTWKRYMKFNSRSICPNFQPDLFLEPLRSKMEFIESVVKTQHFMSYAEHQYNLLLQHEQDMRIFLHDWIYFHWRIKHKS